jgi:hypothetical protein
VMTLQGVLLADHFNVRPSSSIHHHLFLELFLDSLWDMVRVIVQLQMKYCITNVPSKPNTCSVLVLLGIAWLKSTKQQKKVTKSIISNTSNGLKELFAEVEKELTSSSSSHPNVAAGPTTA